ncbi:MAG: cbb3-type cytochrome c oxidase subunit 3 [Paracoccaceae bacterium]
METYTFLRELADSWVLLGLFGFFVAAVLFAFRPGSKSAHKDMSEIPFRHEDRPAPDDVSQVKEPL